MVTEADQAELHAAILAYWNTMDLDGEPPPEWKRRLYRLLFGVACLAPDDLPIATPGPFWERWAAAKGLLSLLEFHLNALSPDNPLAVILCQRMRDVSGQALELYATLQQKQEEADDAQAA